MNKRIKEALEIIKNRNYAIKLNHRIGSRDIANQELQEIGEGIDYALNIIKQEEKDNIFLKVPRKVKLVYLLLNLRQELKGYDVWWQDDTNFIVIENSNDEEDTKYIIIENNKISKIENQGVNELEFFPEWLYLMKLAGTEIEVDL